MASGTRFQILRTSSFRLALQNALLSTFGAIIVFAIILGASRNAITSELDSTVLSEQADVIADARDEDSSMLASVQEATRESDGTFYALTGPGGIVLAGNLVISPQAARAWQTGRRTLRREDGVALPPHLTAIRGLATSLPGGETLYVAENASALRALGHLISDAFLGVFGTLLVIGVGGGTLVARQTMRRVDAMSSTAREIMAGDLSRRIPANGSGDEFDRLATNLNAMLARIQILMENIRQVSNDIAHDLRSPLARLREHLELAGRTALDLPARSAFEEGITQVDTALGIFGAMLRIAEIEAGARRRDFRAVDLAKLLRDLAETFETVADAEGRKLSAEIAADLHVWGDAELLTQMFVNLIENAIRHTPRLSRIRLEARHEPDRVRVCIADNGPGIPPGEYRRVLQRFVRLDASRHSPGTGLGLALVAAVVELHDGNIEFSDNAPGLKVAVIFKRHD